MEQDFSNGENEWILDSLIGFLKGPMWTEPLFVFVYEKSVVFDPEDLEENQKEYRLIFNDYKATVDKLLETHMNELQITPEQFETSCEEAEGILSSKLHTSLFEQVWAAEDFDAFKRMMIQINIDLQLQALEILAAKYGIIPDSFIPEGATRHDFVGHENDFFMREAKKRSLADCDDKIIMVQVEREHHEESSPETEPEPKVEPEPGPELKINGSKMFEKQDVEEIPFDGKSANEKYDDHVSVKKQGQTKDDEQDTSVSKVQGMGKQLGELKIRKMGKVDNSTPFSRKNEPNSFERFDESPVTPSAPCVTLANCTSLMNLTKVGLDNADKSDVDSDEIKQRQRYLREQRDRLLNLKKEERSKQMAKAEALLVSGRRPQTAKFIAKDLEEEPEAKNMAYMRSLAARIKAEVMDEGADEDKAKALNNN